MGNIGVGGGVHKETFAAVSQRGNLGGLQFFTFCYFIMGWPLPYFGHYIGGGDIMHSVCWSV